LFLELFYWDIYKGVVFFMIVAFQLLPKAFLVNSVKCFCKSIFILPYFWYINKCGGKSFGGNVWTLGGHWVDKLGQNHTYFSLLPNAYKNQK